MDAYYVQKRKKKRRGERAEEQPATQAGAAACLFLLFKSPQICDSPSPISRRWVTRPRRRRRWRRRRGRRGRRARRARPRRSAAPSQGARRGDCRGTIRQAPCLRAGQPGCACIVIVVVERLVSEPASQTAPASSSSAPLARSPATAPVPVATPPTAASLWPTLAATATDLLPERSLSSPSPVPLVPPHFTIGSPAADSP